jgi:hypothetical protein
MVPRLAGFVIYRALLNLLASKPTSRSSTKRVKPHEPSVDEVPTRERWGHHLQVVDSRELKSATHLVSRTALTFESLRHSRASRVRSPKSITRHLATTQE